jgi:hypothetical protein
VKRVAVISDGHCGHVYGLTPPNWQCGLHRPAQRQLWTWFAKNAAEIGHVDVLIANGDMIDGDGPKSGGTELITTDRLTQAEMAAEAIRCFNADKVRVVAGTAYHAGHAEEFERPVADKTGGTYGGEWFGEVEGVHIHARHHIGVAQMPHTKATPILKALLMDAMASKCGPGGEKADVVIRSHAHSFVVAGGDLGLGFVTDGLQLRSRIGRRLDGWSDVGMLIIDVNGEDVRWERRRFNPPNMARVAEKI